MKKVIVIILFLGLLSCAAGLSIFRIIHVLNVKEAKDESPEEISKFLKNKKYTHDESVLLIDSLLTLRKIGGYIFANQDGVNDRIAALQIRIF